MSRRTALCVKKRGLRMTNFQTHMLVLFHGDGQDTEIMIIATDDASHAVREAILMCIKRGADDDCVVRPDDIYIDGVMQSNPDGGFSYPKWNFLQVDWPEAGT